MELNASMTESDMKRCGWPDAVESRDDADLMWHYPAILGHFDCA